jgi:small-conductance mechanosensitive channel
LPLVHPLVCLLGLLMLAGPAQGQVVTLPGVATHPAPAASAAVPALSQAEAREMIDLLNDPQKRAAFTANLQTLAKASAAVNPSKTAATGPVPLTPNSLFAQLLSESARWAANLSHQAASFGRVLGGLPAVWVFTLHTLNDPAARSNAFDAAWRLLVVLVGAGVAEFALDRLLRRPRHDIARHTPAMLETGFADEPHAEEHDPLVRAKVLAREGVGADGEETAPLAVSETDAEPIDKAVEHALRRRRFARTLRALKRLPFVLLCFLLDLMPLALFLGLAYGGGLFLAPQFVAVLQAAILAYAACRLATSVTRMFVSPDMPEMRLLHVSDEGAVYAVRWVRRVFAVAAFGFAAAQIGLLFGLPQAADDAFLKAIFLVVHIFLVIVVLQCRRGVADRIRSHLEKPGFAGLLRNRIASIWHLIAIFYIVGLWLVWAAEIRHGYLRIWHIFLVSVGVVVIVRLVAIVLLGGLDRTFRQPSSKDDTTSGLQRRVSRYYPILRGTISGALTLAGALLMMQAWGINTLSWFKANALGGRLVSASITVLIAGAIALAVWEGVNASMDGQIARLTREAQVMKSARLRTLLPMLRTGLLCALIAVFGLTALSQIGVDIGPLLAGAGILGVAIGFGSQKLVQDFITGIFLLLENAMQVGDWVTVAGLSGSVENLSIRTMRLRAGDGSVHIIPFSSVSTVTNVNRGIGNAAVTVNIPIEEDSDHVCDLLGEIATTMRAEKRFADMMRSDLQLWGVDKVDAGVVTIAGQIVCTDSGRWAVQREFNRRMMIRFKEQGLRIATPVSTVFNHVANETPAPVQQIEREAAPNQLAESPPPAALGNTS